MKQGNIVLNTLALKDLIEGGEYQVDLLDDIHQLGLKKVEIRREYLRNKEELAELKEKAEHLDIELFYSVPDILFEGSLLAEETLTQYFEEYNQLGAKQLKLVAGYIDNVSATDMEKLKSLINHYEIHHLTLENDQSGYSSPEKLKQLVHRLNYAEMKPD